MEEEYKDYHVTWEIDIRARNPKEAAEAARAAQTRVDTIATVFDCTDEEGDTHRVDLTEDEVIKV